MHNKNFLLGLFFVMYSQSIISMETGGVDYDHFFKLCCDVNIREIAAFLNENPTFDINHIHDCENTVSDKDVKRIQTTAFLYAASLCNWPVVWHLLNKCGTANMMLADSYGQTLFSYAVYYNYVVGSGRKGAFRKLLDKYSLAEINILCKTMPLHKNDRYDAFDSCEIEPIIAALEQKTDVNHVDYYQGRTLLGIACRYDYIPYTIQLLKCGARLDIKDRHNKTSYDALEDGNVSSRFVVREAFNDGSCIPAAALICHALEALKEENSDVVNYIKQLYCKATLLDDSFFESPKAGIWEPVCVEACKIAGIEDVDENRCLAKILFMPQEQLTQVNKTLALQDK